MKTHDCNKSTITIAQCIGASAIACECGEVFVRVSLLHKAEQSLAQANERAEALEKRVAFPWMDAMNRAKKSEAQVRVLERLVVEKDRALQDALPYFEGEHSHDHHTTKSMQNALSATPASVREIAEAEGAVIEAAQAVCRSAAEGNGPLIADLRRKGKALDAARKIKEKINE